MFRAHPSRWRPRQSLPSTSRVGGVDFRAAFDRDSDFDGAKHLEVLEVDLLSSVEKFADPIFDCLGKGIAPKLLAVDYLSGVGVPYMISPNRVGVPEDLGFAYLKDVPPRSGDRIAALRAHIGVAPPAMVQFPKTDVGDIAEASFQNLQKIGQHVISIYADEGKYDGIAKSFGMSLADVKAQATQVMAAQKLPSQPAFIETAMKYAPAASALGNAAFAYASGGSIDSLKIVEAVGSAVATAAAGVVPIVGAVVQLATTLYTQSELARQKLIAGVCQEFKRNYVAIATKTGDEGFPIPLHLLSDAGAPCTDKEYDYDKILFIEATMAANHLVLRGLSAEYKRLVLEWWGLSLTLMSHPEVYAVFDKLGHGTASFAARGRIHPPFSPGGGSGAIYGGLLASDEQVMMVAAPIAIANGLSVDAFAKALWQKSKGWRDADPASMMILPKGIRFDFNDTGDPMDTVTVYACPDYVANAYWLQLAVLTRDAFELVDEVKSRFGLFVPRLFTPPKSAASSLIFPAALSVGAGYLAASALGGPIGLAIGAAVFFLTMPRG